MTHVWSQVLLRAAARSLGLPEAASRVKRAIQFGSALAKLSNVAEFGSNRKANLASAGSVKIRTGGGRGGGNARNTEQEAAGGGAAGETRGADSNEATVVTPQPLTSKKTTETVSAKDGTSRQGR